MKKMFFLTYLACTKDQIPSLNIFKNENSKSLTLTLRSCPGSWIVLITTLYKYLSSYQISTKCIRIRSNNLICLLEVCIPVTYLGLAYQGKFHCYDKLWYPFTLSHICKMNNTLFRSLNCFDIKRLIFLQCWTCFCKNKEKGVTKRYQRYICLAYVFNFRTDFRKSLCVFIQIHSSLQFMHQIRIRSSK